MNAYDKLIGAYHLGSHGSNHWTLVVRQIIFCVLNVVMCILQQVLEPKFNKIVFIDQMGDESNRLMNQIQKNWNIQ